MKKWLFIICIVCLNFVYFDQITTAATKGREEYEKTGHVIWDVKVDEKIVALTFDDGPHPVFTPQILDVLAKHNVKATFFVMGAHAKKYSYLVHRLALESHEIGNHTFNHIYNINNSDKLKEELDSTADIIQQITGIKTNLYRPVGGLYNDMIVNTAIENDYEVIMWSWHQDSKDWKRPGVDKIVNHVISDTRPGDIILFHDAGGDRSQTVEALDTILTVFKEEGYECVTVSELIN